MVFSSLTFIFFFLSITAGLYFINQSLVWRNAVLLIASLFFYAWGEPKLVLLMLIVSLVAYFGAILIDRFPRVRKLTYVITLVLISSNLFIFKYLNFMHQALTSFWAQALILLR